MELTREIYWNVGKGVLIPMYLLMGIAFLLAGYYLWQRICVYRLGQPLRRTDDPLQRLKHALSTMLLQNQVMRVPGAGTAHGLFFWCFVLLVLGTTLVFIQADITEPLFDVKFLRGSFYLGFSLVLDLAGLLGILMLLGLMIRRYLLRPPELPQHPDNLLMHGLLLIILVTGFLIEGARMAVTEIPGNPFLAAWSPVGLLVAKAMAGMSEPSLRSTHQFLWWLHLVLVGGFFVAIPLTRFRHLVTTATNYFLYDRRPKGSIRTLDLEDEEAESFGTGSLPELTWKDIFDSDACTYCKRCQDRCPAWATEKPLSPMKVVNQIGELAFADPGGDLIGTVTPEVLWECTTCRACQEICPAEIEHVNIILEMRRHLALMQGEFPGVEVQAAMEHTEVNGNPMGLAYAGRGDWAEGLGIKPLAEDAEVDLLYFVGCYASFDRRNQQVARSFIKLCQAAGLKVGILGREEKCCGEPMRKLGNEYLYQTVAQENIAVIQGYGVQKIVTTCPHCFNTLARDYPELGMESPVEHYTTFLAKLMQQGRLPLVAEPFAYTYHDSCYIGRYMDIYEEPRELLKNAGGALTEMAHNRSDSFCCGGGGGLVLAEERVGTRISETRAKMAAETGAPQMVSNCPFCLTMFEDGIKGVGLDESFSVRDLAEILVDRLDI